MIESSELFAKPSMTVLAVDGVSSAPYESLGHIVANDDAYDHRDRYYNYDNYDWRRGPSKA